MKLKKSKMKKEIEEARTSLEQVKKLQIEIQLEIKLKLTEIENPEESITHKMEQAEYKIPDLEDKLTEQDYSIKEAEKH